MDAGGTGGRDREMGAEPSGFPHGRAEMASEESCARRHLHPELAVCGPALSLGGPTSQAE